MNKIYQGVRVDTGKIISGSLLYDSDSECWRIVLYTFEIEDAPIPTDQFGVCAYEVDPNSIEAIAEESEQQTNDK